MSALDDIRTNYEEQYRQLQADLESLQQTMAELEETAHSPDGLIAATIGARGELKDLVLDPRIYRTSDAKALAAGIMATIRDATDAVTARMIELTEPLLPEGIGRNDGIDSIVQHFTGRGEDR